MIDFEPFDDWHEYTIDDAKAIGALMGFDIENVYFTGFCSQGDGAQFTGSIAYKPGCVRNVKAYAPLDAELHRIAQAWQSAQAAVFYAGRATVQHRGHYHHSRCVAFNWDRLEFGTQWRDLSIDESEALEDVARAFMDWIYRALEREYEYQRAWQCAQVWQEARDECATAWQEARALCTSIRDAKRHSLTLDVAAMRQKLADILESMESPRNTMNEADDAFFYEQMTVETFAREHV